MSKKCNHYWTLEKCQTEALKFKTRTEYQKNNKGSYLSAYRNNWLDLICQHMIIKKLDKNYLTYDKCRELALKCNSRTEFNIKHNSAYNKAIKNDWLNDICSHMMIIGNRFNRCVYVWEFNDKSAYIGLTYKLEERIIQHTTNLNSPVFNYLKIVDGNCKQLTEYINVNDAKILEMFYINEYKNSNWKLLNNSNGGELGSNSRKWTKETCHTEALKYTTKSDYQKNSCGSYLAALRNNWISDICTHMIELKKLNNYWTYDNCKKESLKYLTKKDFKMNSTGAYHSSLINGWINSICTHMIEVKKPKGYWTKEKCYSEFLKYDSNKEFKENNPSAYSKAYKMHWMQEFTGK